VIDWYQQVAGQWTWRFLMYKRTKLMQATLIDINSCNFAPLNFTFISLQNIREQVTPNKCIYHHLRLHTNRQVRRFLYTNIHTSYHLLTAWHLLPIFGTIDLTNWTVIVSFWGWIQMVTYLTSLFALSSTVIPTTLSEFFDYGLGCLRQGYQSDGRHRTDTGWFVSEM